MGVNKQGFSCRCENGSDFFEIEGGYLRCFECKVIFGCFEDENGRTKAKMNLGQTPMSELGVTPSTQEQLWQGGSDGETTH